MKKSMIRMLCLTLCLVSLVSLIPVTAQAATVTLGTPKNLKWNKAFNYDTQALQTKYGMISWTPVAPFTSKTLTWYEIRVYRNGSFIYSHQVGYDTSYLKQAKYISFDLTPVIDWEDGSYYFTVQTINREGGNNSGKRVKSTSWTYTKPSASMPVPENPTWDFPYATWDTVGNGNEYYHINMYYSETGNESPEWFWNEWLIWDGELAVPYSMGPGYYYFRVRTVSDNIRVRNNSEWTELSEPFYFEMNAPTVRAENAASTGKPKIIWNSVAHADKYEVYRKASTSGTYKKIKTTTNKYYTDSTAVTGTTYYYKVRGVVSAMGDTKLPFSATVSRVCDLPRPVVTASNVASTGKIKLSWKALTGAVEYEIYRRAEGVEEYELYDVTDTNTYTDTAMRAGEKYYYRVKALHTKPSAASAESETVAKVCDLACPTVSIKLDSSGKPSLTWKAVPGATEYKVYRASSKTGTYTLIKTTDGTSCTNPSAKAGRTYYYKVRAIHPVESAISAYSAVKYIKAK